MDQPARAATESTWYQAFDAQPSLGRPTLLKRAVDPGAALIVCSVMELDLLPVLGRSTAARIVVLHVHAYFNATAPPRGATEESVSVPHFVQQAVRSDRIVVCHNLDIVPVANEQGKVSGYVVLPLSLPI